MNYRRATPAKDCQSSHPHREDRGKKGIGQTQMHERSHGQHLLATIVFLFGLTSKVFDQCAQLVELRSCQGLSPDQIHE